MNYTVERIKKMELGNYEFYSDLIEGQLEKKRVKLIKDIIEKEVRPILKRGQKLSMIKNEHSADSNGRRFSIEQEQVHPVSVRYINK